jgi:hypothetical protein
MRDAVLKDGIDQPDLFLLYRFSKFEQHGGPAPFMPEVETNLSRVHQKLTFLLSVLNF